MPENTSFCPVEAIMQVAEDVWQDEDGNSVPPSQEKTKEAAEAVIAIIEKSSYKRTELQDLVNNELIAKIDFYLREDSPVEVQHYRSLFKNANYIFGSAAIEITNKNSGLS